MVLFSLAGQESVFTGITIETLVVFGVILLALVMFAIDRIPIDLTAITIMVVLIVLEPWTQISPQEGISGFSNPATITVLAMLILSAGVSKSGLVQKIGQRMVNFAGTDPMKQLAATIAVAGPTSGFVNNTPVVAILVPVVSDLAHQGKSSPSKLLMPLSFASMLGGMLTVIGTSTNILASDVSERLLDHPFSMFEFFHLGVIVLVVGSVYLLTIGYRLLPERVEPEEDFIEEYELGEYLAEVIVTDGSPVVGKTLESAFEDTDFDIDVLQIARGSDRFIQPVAQTFIRADDRFKIRTDRETLEQLLATEGFIFGATDVTEAALEEVAEEQSLVEVVIHTGSDLIGETLETSSFRQRYDASVLAFRSHGQLIRERLDRVRFRVGDTLLIQAPEGSIERLARNPDFVVAHEPRRPEYRTRKIPHVILIIAGVVGLPALNVIPIVVSALAGVVAMVIAGVLKPTELYDSVNWNVIFLLAGVIPLGIALEQSGGADMLANLVALSATLLPAIGVLWVFYVITGLITNVISNNASVVLMIPVAIETAYQLNANAFAFVLAVTFAASTAFITPVGYQTNLFVYGPGGYKFTDFFWVGAPLQLLLSVVTVAGIAMFWGLSP